ncbi:UNKNOWN [Stylonychia lemnae]|uniref:TRP C-terminal domain-containing protein n=1 Tax=Stylonychia lemnae TaxID=5949 RepID=A0A078ALA1_STYLE|nr:UNKNOWN [Stylonychia lemnae]|eukprot:CDW81643.1 UNKNOWN [Stylonychia lemnae]
MAFAKEDNSIQISQIESNSLGELLIGGSITDLVNANKQAVVGYYYNRNNYSRLKWFRQYEFSPSSNFDAIDVQALAFRDRDMRVMFRTNQDKSVIAKIETLNGRLAYQFIVVNYRQSSLHSQMLIAPDGSIYGVFDQYDTFQEGILFKFQSIKYDESSDKIITGGSQWNNGQPFAFHMHIINQDSSLFFYQYYADTSSPFESESSKYYNAQFSIFEYSHGDQFMFGCYQKNIENEQKLLGIVVQSIGDKTQMFNYEFFFDQPVFCEGLRYQDNALQIQALTQLQGLQKVLMIKLKYIIEQTYEIDDNVEIIEIVKSTQSSQTMDITRQRLLLTGTVNFFIGRDISNNLAAIFSDSAKSLYTELNYFKIIKKSPLNSPDKPGEVSGIYQVPDLRNTQLKFDDNKISCTISGKLELIETPGVDAGKTIICYEENLQSCKFDYSTYVFDECDEPILITTKVQDSSYSNLFTSNNLEASNKQEVLLDSSLITNNPLRIIKNDPSQYTRVYATATFDDFEYTENFKIEMNIGYQQCLPQISLVNAPMMTNKIYEYFIKDLPLSVQLPIITYTPSACGQIHYHFSIEGYTDFPSIFSYDQDSSQISVVSNDLNDVGEYEFLASASVQLNDDVFSPQLSQYTFRISVKEKVLQRSQTYVNYPPKLTGLPQDQIINCGQQSQYQLPQIFDLEDEGDYIVKIVVQEKENVKQQNSYSFNLKVLAVFQVNLNSSSYFENGQNLSVKQPLQSNLSGQVKARIQKITQAGIVHIVFDKSMKIPITYELVLNETFKIEVINERYAYKVNYTIREYKDNQLMLQMKFSQSMRKSISIHDTDNLRLTFVKNEFYLSSNERFIVTRNYQLIGYIPPQIDPVLIPSNTLSFFAFMNDISSLNLIPIDDFNQKYLEIDLYDDQAFNQYFDFMNYSSSNTIINLGLLFYFFMSQLGMVALALMIKLFNLHKKQRILKKIHDESIFNAPLRFMYSTYLELFFCSISNLYYFKIALLGEKLSSTLSFIFISMLFAFPILSFYLVFRIHEEQRENKFTNLLSNSLRKFVGQFTKTCGGLYIEGIKDDNLIQKLYVPLLVLRKVCVCLIMVFIQNSQNIQLMSLIFFNSLILFFIILVKPLNDPKQVKITIMNELMYTIICYSFLPFMDNNYFLDADLRERLGFIPIGLTLLYMILNLSFILKENINKLREQCTKNKSKRQRKFKTEFQEYKVSSNEAINKTMLSSIDLSDCQETILFKRSTNHIRNIESRRMNKRPTISKQIFEVEDI